MNKILIVEDDKDLNQMICKYLSNNGFIVSGCLSAADAYDALYEKTYDLIVSDVMMPDIDGFEFTKTIRELNNQIPVLFVSARDDINSKQRGFSLGIDDYMVKPIDLEELVLRINALLRRANINTNHQITVGDFIIDANATTATYCDTQIPLTLREFNLLYKLLSYPNRTFSRTQLMNEFWDSETETSSRAVDVYVTKLRDKCSDVSSFAIVTVHGLGYKVVVS